MPVLTEADHREKRRRPWLWMLPVGTGLVLLLLAGLMAWGWERPVTLKLCGHGVGFGHGTPAFAAWQVAALERLRSTPPALLETQVIDVRQIPGGTQYWVWWY